MARRRKISLQNQADDFDERMSKARNNTSGEPSLPASTPEGTTFGDVGDNAPENIEFPRFFHATTHPVNRIQFSGPADIPDWAKTQAANQARLPVGAPLPVPNPQQRIPTMAVPTQTPALQQASTLPVEALSPHAQFQQMLSDKGYTFNPIAMGQSGITRYEIAKMNSKQLTGRVLTLDLSLSPVNNQLGPVWLAGNRNRERDAAIISPSIVGAFRSPTDIRFSTESSTQALFGMVEESFSKVLRRSATDPNRAFGSLVSSQEMGLMRTPWNTYESTENRAIRSIRTRVSNLNPNVPMAPFDIEGVYSRLSASIEGGWGEIGGSELSTSKVNLWQGLRRGGYYLNEAKRLTPASYYPLTNPIYGEENQVFLDRPPSKVTSKPGIGYEGSIAKPYNWVQTEQGRRLVETTPQFITGKGMPDYGYLNFLMPGETQRRRAELGRVLITPTMIQGGGLMGTRTVPSGIETEGYDVLHPVALRGLKDIRTLYAEGEANPLQLNAEAYGHIIEARRKFSIGTYKNMPINLRAGSSPVAINNMILEIPAFYDPLTGEAKPELQRGVSTASIVDKIKARFPGMIVRNTGIEETSLAIAGAAFNVPSKIGRLGEKVGASPTGQAMSVQFGGMNLPVDIVSSEVLKSSTAITEGFFGAQSNENIAKIFQRYGQYGGGEAATKLGQWITQNKFGKGGEPLPMSWEELNLQYGALGGKAFKTGAQLGLDVFRTVFEEPQNLMNLQTPIYASAGEKAAIQRQIRSGRMRNINNLKTFEAGWVPGVEYSYGPTSASQIEYLQGMVERVRSSTSDAQLANLGAVFNVKRQNPQELATNLLKAVREGEPGYEELRAIASPNAFYARMALPRHLEFPARARANPELMEALSRRFPNVATALGLNVSQLARDRSPDAQALTAAASYVSWELGARKVGGIGQARPASYIPVDRAKMLELSGLMSAGAPEGTENADTAILQTMRTSLGIKEKDYTPLWLTDVNRPYMNPNVPLTLQYTEYGEAIGGIEKSYIRSFQKLSNVGPGEEDLANKASQGIFGLFRNMFQAGGEAYKKTFGRSMPTGLAGRYAYMGALGVNQQGFTEAWIHPLDRERMLFEAGFRGKELKGELRRMAKGGPTAGFAVRWPQTGAEESIARMALIGDQDLVGRIGQEAYENIIRDPRTPGVMYVPQQFATQGIGDFDYDPFTGAFLLGGGKQKARAFRELMRGATMESQSTEAIEKRLLADPNLANAASGMYQAVSSILDPTYNPVEKVRKGAGFYSIEDIQQKAAISRWSKIGMGTGYNVARAVIPAMAIAGYSDIEMSRVAAGRAAIYQPHLDIMNLGPQSAGNPLAAMVAKARFAYPEGGGPTLVVGSNIPEGGGTKTFKVNLEESDTRKVMSLAQHVATLMTQPITVNAGEKNERKYRLTSSAVLAQNFAQPGEPNYEKLKARLDAVDPGEWNAVISQHLTEMETAANIPAGNTPEGMKARIAFNQQLFQLPALSQLTTRAYAKAMGLEYEKGGIANPEMLAEARTSAELWSNKYQWGPYMKASAIWNLVKRKVSVPATDLQYAYQYMRETGQRAEMRTMMKQMNIPIPPDTPTSTNVAPVPIGPEGQVFAQAAAAKGLTPEQAVTGGNVPGDILNAALATGQTPAQIAAPVMARYGAPGGIVSPTLMPRADLEATIARVETAREATGARMGEPRLRGQAAHTMGEGTTATKAFAASFVPIPPEATLGPTGQRTGGGEQWWPIAEGGPEGPQKIMRWQLLPGVGRGRAPGTIAQQAERLEEAVIDPVTGTVSASAQRRFEKRPISETVAGQIVNTYMTMYEKFKPPPQQPGATGIGNQGPEVSGFMQLVASLQGGGYLAMGETDAAAIGPAIQRALKGQQLPGANPQSAMPPLEFMSRVLMPQIRNIKDLGKLYTKANVANWAQQWAPGRMQTEDLRLATQSMVQDIRPGTLAYAAQGAFAATTALPALGVGANFNKIMELERLGQDPMLATITGGFENLQATLGRTPTMAESVQTLRTVVQTQPGAKGFLQNLQWAMKSTPASVMERTPQALQELGSLVKATTGYADAKGIITGKTEERYYADPAIARMQTWRDELIQTTRVLEEQAKIVKMTRQEHKAFNEGLKARKTDIEEMGAQIGRMRGESAYGMASQRYQRLSERVLAGEGLTKTEAAEFLAGPPAEGGGPPIGGGRGGGGRGAGGPEGTEGFSRWARRALGGFGLMYLRSIFGLMTENVGWGAAEADQLNTVTQQVLGQQLGATNVFATPQQRAQIAMGLAGGGQSAQTMLNILQARNPNARGIFQAGIAGVSAAGMMGWMGQMAGLTLPGAALGGIGAAVAVGSYALSAWGLAQDPNATAYQLTQAGARITPNGAINQNNFGNMQASLAAIFQNQQQRAQTYRMIDLYSQLNMSTSLSNMIPQFGIAAVGGALSQFYQGNNYIPSPEAAAQTAAFYTQYAAAGWNPYNQRTAQQMGAYFAYGVNPQEIYRQYFAALGRGSAEQFGINNLGQITADSIRGSAAAYQQAAAERGEVIGNVKAQMLTSAAQKIAQIPFAERMAPITGTSQVYRTEQRMLLRRGNQTLLGTPLGVGTTHIFETQEMANQRAAEEYMAQVDALTKQQFQMYQYAMQAWGANANMGITTPQPQVTEFANLTPTALDLTTGEYKANLAASANQERMNIATLFGNAGVRTGGMLGTQLQGMGEQILNASLIPGRGMQFVQGLAQGNPLTWGMAAKGLGINLGNYSLQQQTGGQIPAWMGAMTDVGMNGQLTGMAWGTTSLAVPGGPSAMQMANRIWGGAGWQDNATLRNMVFGVTLPNGQQVGGQYALQYSNIMTQYKYAMASAGNQMAGLNLNMAFTTGVGIGNYAGTINPQTGQPFGFNTGRFSFDMGALGSYTSQGGGMWGLQDTQRALGIAQNLEGFRQQQARINLGSRQFYENLGMNIQQSQVQRQWAQQDWQYQGTMRGLQWQWTQEDFREQSRFMTGRDRRLAERQMDRATTTHNLEDEQIKKTQARQKELWTMEDQRFDLQKKQYEENKRMSEEELKIAKRFFEERNRLEEESIKMQRAMWVEQMALQKQAIGISAAAAAEQKKLGLAMLEYNLFMDQTKGALDMLDKDAFPKLLAALDSDIPGAFSDMIAKLIASAGGGGGGGDGGDDKRPPPPTNKPTPHGYWYWDYATKSWKWKQIGGGTPENIVALALFGDAVAQSDRYAQAMLAKKASYDSSFLTNNATAQVQPIINVYVGNEAFQSYIIRTVENEIRQ